MTATFFMILIAVSSPYGVQLERVYLGATNHQTCIQQGEDISVQIRDMLEKEEGIRPTVAYECLEYSADDYAIPTTNL